jgi:ribosomal protein S20
MKQTAVRRERNVATKRSMRSALKAFTASPSSDNLRQAQSEIDTAVKKNLLPKATAARRKSSLAKAAKAAGVTLAKAPTKKAVSATKKTAKKPVATAKPTAKKTAPKTASKKAPAKKPSTKKPA